MNSKKHQPCPDCGSRDALQINPTYNWCHSCKKYTGTDGNAKTSFTGSASPTPSEPIKVQGITSLKTTLSTGDYKGCLERGITGQTMKTFGVLLQGDKAHFPYYAVNDATEPVAIKTRFPDKKFPISGEWKKATMFGKQLFSKGGKYITIVEGEYDALAAYQMQGSKWPTVSIRNGASAALKDCKDNYEFLDSFDCIVIDFDSDEPGQLAAKEVAELFGGKSKIMRHSNDFKDACEYLANNQGQQYKEDFWRADQFVPDGIVAGVDLWDEVNKPVEKAELLYPFEGINEITYGIRKGEFVTVAAGSGVGKTQFIKEIIYRAVNTTKDNIGLLMLEESNKHTGRGLMSLYTNKPLHLPDVEITEEESREAFDNTVGCGRVFLFNHFGSTAIDNIIARVRYMAKALNCKYIVLDHISIVVSAQENSDERRAIDEIMTKLRMLVSETGIALIAVSHLRRPEGKGHEEGASTSLSQLRGSASIAQLSDICIGLERNGQHEDHYERNITYPRVLKNRFSGETGVCTGIHFDKETCRMNEINEEVL
jgi:twinkle protein